MVKNLYFFLAISFAFVLIIPTAFTCDPLGCLFVGGDKQDTLILGEIVSVSENSFKIEVLFIFPQNQIKSLKEGNQIMVRDLTKAINLDNLEVKAISIGKKYLMSLNQEDDFYVPAWGVYEIIGNTYSNARLIKNESIDDEALQIFINSGGTERDFGFDYSGYKPVLIIKGERQSTSMKVENIIWYGTGILFLASIGGLLLIINKKK